jgi:D-alanyl-D-alanine carboxypeptidase
MSFKARSFQPWIWLIPLLAGCSSTASESDAGRSAACIAQDTSLQQALDLARGGQPNAMLAVRNADCGTTVYISGNPDYAKQTSLWRVYSVTKTFVSASILSLVKEGTVSLDDPLSRWVPNVTGTTGVTVRMLLDHRSGIFDYGEDPTFYCTKTKPWTPQEIVDLATTHAPYFAPDASFHYSSTNYILLGMILEAATGQQAGAVLHARAIDVAGLEATFLDGFDQVDPVRMAHGFYPSIYEYDDVTFAIDPSCVWTAAAMVASGADLADWVATLYGSNTVLDASQRALLSSTTSDAGRTGVTYGLGATFLDESSWQAGHPGRAIGHVGGGIGYETFAFYFPDKETAIVAVVNHWVGSPSVSIPVAQAAVTALFP